MEDGDKFGNMVKLTLLSIIGQQHKEKQVKVLISKLGKQSDCEEVMLAVFALPDEMLFDKIKLINHMVKSLPLIHG